MTSGFVFGFVWGEPACFTVGYTSPRYRRPLSVTAFGRWWAPPLGRFFSKSCDTIRTLGRRQSLTLDCYSSFF